MPSWEVGSYRKTEFGFGVLSLVAKISDVTNVGTVLSAPLMSPHLVLEKPFDPRPLVHLFPSL